MSWQGTAVVLGGLVYSYFLILHGASMFDAEGLTVGTEAPLTALVLPASTMGTAVRGGLHRIGAALQKSEGK